MASYDDHVIGVGRAAGGSDAFRIWFRYSGGAYQLRTNLADDGTTYPSTAYYPIADAPHFVEIDWAAATAPGANNGYISLWIDGVLQETVSGVDNDTRRIEQVRLGPQANLDVGTSGTEYFDAFESRRSTYIGPVSSSRRITTTINYTYDPLYRLTNANYSGAYTYTFAYAYDAVGNRTVQTRTITSTQVITYQYDNANRMTQTGGITFTWDNNGNLTNDGTATYLYDRANRMISTTVGGITTQFSYNGDGARIKQTVAGAVTTYTQDLAAPLPVILQAKTGSATMQYLYALGTRPLAQNSGAWQYLLPDALGSVRQIADANGNVTLAESYEPYGSALTSTGTASSIFGYAGEQLDTTGLIYLRARYLNPALGIFLAKDPWSGDVLRPGSMNGWQYVSGNPVNRIDPTGQVDLPQCSVEDEFGICVPCILNDLYKRADLTQWLVNEMNTQRRSDIVDSMRINLAHWEDPLFGGNPLSFYASYGVFRELVNKNRRWDFKVKIEEIIGRNIRLAGDWYDFQVPGNIFFGYIGVAIGFKEAILHCGADSAEQGGYFCSGSDPLWDYEAIEVGFDMWRRSGGGDVDKSILRNALTAHKDVKQGIPTFPLPSSLNFPWPYPPGTFDGR